MIRQPPNRSRDGRLRFRDRRQSVITLPPTAKCLVEQDELDRDSLLGDDALLLHLKLLALGVENLQDVRQATVIALERQINGSTALREGGLQILQTYEGRSKTALYAPAAKHRPHWLDDLGDGGAQSSRRSRASSSPANAGTTRGGTGAPTTAP
jgi:hypothetical protein